MVIMDTKKSLYLIFKNIILVVFIVQLSSCTSEFEEINTPPISTLTVDPGLLLTDVQRSIVPSDSGEDPNNVTGSWIQHWGGGPIVGESRYIQQPFNIMGRYYSKLRSLALIKNELLVGLENDPKGRTKLAIAKIMEIYTWQNLTDMYGPVPYSESSQPLGETIRQPKYDTQESIYNALISDLDIALAQLNASDESYGNADLFYDGDVDLWRKFGYSLKLRLGMRIKYADPALSKATVESALSNATIDSNVENADVPTANAITSNRHPILNQFFGGSPDLLYLAEELVDVLLATNDPRLPLIADPNTGGTTPEYRGIKVAETDSYYSSIIRSQYSLASTQTYFNEEKEIPVHAISYAEVSFFKAEAALEGWGGLTEADAEEFYTKGIIAAMAMEPYDIPEADIPVAYIASEFSLTGTKEEKLEKIMGQKWIMLFGKNLEAWSEWRRTGYPTLVPGPFAGGDQLIPRRYIYPTDEALVNSENYANVVSTLSNGDTYRSKVWWDKK